MPLLRVPIPTLVLPLKKLTEPVGATPLPDCVTVAVRVAGDPSTTFPAVAAVVVLAFEMVTMATPLDNPKVASPL